MLKTKMITPFALTLVAASTAFAPHALAGSQTNNAHQVRYAHAELATPEKAEAILARIHETANEVCWKELGPERHVEKAKVRACLSDVTHDLVDQISNANLDIAQTKLPAPTKLTRSRAKVQLALTEIDLK